MPTPKLPPKRKPFRIISFFSFSLCQALNLSWVCANEFKRMTINSAQSVFGRRPAVLYQQRYPNQQHYFIFYNALSVRVAFFGSRHRGSNNHHLKTINFNRYASRARTNHPPVFVLFFYYLAEQRAPLCRALSVRTFNVRRAVLQLEKNQHLHAGGGSGGANDKCEFDTITQLAAHVINKLFTNQREDKNKNI